MPSRTLGPNAPAIFPIGYGGMPLSTAGRPSEAQAIRSIHTALDSGVTLIDTADVYCLDDNDVGHNERLIAKALRQWPGSQDNIIVATKGGLTRPGGRWVSSAHPDHLRRAFERSLKALGVDRIDLYQLHAPDPDVPYADSIRVLAELKEKGKIRWAGISNVSVEEIEQANNIVEITTVQNRLSPFFREAIKPGPRKMPSVVDHCASKGIGFLAYSPVGGGRLNRRLPTHPVLQPIARRLNASPHAVALAWVLAQGPTVIPIPGARDPEHVRDSIGAAELRLTEEDQAAISRASFSVA